MVLAAIAVPIALALGASATLPSLAKEFKKNIETEENRSSVDTPQYREIARAGYEGLETRPQGFVDKFVSALPLAAQLDERTRMTFFNAAEEKAKALGYSDKEANRLANLAVRVDLYPGSFGEAGALAYGSIASEQVGEQVAKQFVSKIPLEKLTVAATKSFNPLKNPLAAAAIKGVAPAGFLEGGADVIASEVATRGFERRTPEQILLNVGLGGAAGAATAGLFAIPTTGQVLARPRLSKASQYLGYAFDPLEYPGDVGQAVLARRLGEEGFRIPVRVGVANVGVASNVFSDVFGLNANAPSQTSIQSNAQSNVQNQANVQSQVNANVQSQTNTNQNNTGSNDQTNRRTNVSALVDTTADNRTIAGTVPSEVLINSNQNTQTNENANADDNVQANTNTNTNVATEVGTPTPIFRGFVPLPPLFGFSLGGSGGNSRQKRVFYFDELGRANRILKDLL